MDLHSNFPFWPLRHGIIAHYPSLQKDIRCDVAVMGGGVSGALTAWHLLQAGYDVVLVDKRHIAMGSTAASTSLLQYELDIPLRELAMQKGETDAFRCYNLCVEAIDKIEKICSQVNAKVTISRHPSFQFASFKKDRAPLLEEFELRRKAGISVRWLELPEIRKKFGFAKPGGILSKAGAGLDVFAFTHHLLTNGMRKGLRVYDHTDIVDTKYSKKDVTLVTGDRRKIKARHLVIACGYESQRYIPFKIQELHSTFAIISEPMPVKHSWYRDALIWETANPYLYMRVTADRRFIIGGKDVPTSDPVKRDSLIPAKAKALETSFRKFFPTIPFKTDFKWAGSFASTKDGLPYIGSIPQLPRTYFALGLGGNGITFSLIAAEIITSILAGKELRDARLFRMDR